MRKLSFQAHAHICAASLFNRIVLVQHQQHIGVRHFIRERNHVVDFGFVVFIIVIRFGFGSSSLSIFGKKKHIKENRNNERRLRKSIELVGRDLRCAKPMEYKKKRTQYDNINWQAKQSQVRRKLNRKSLAHIYLRVPSHTTPCIFN